jgi:hypothetical protein
MQQMTMLGELLDELSEGHSLDPITDTKRVDSQRCELESGEESLFVTMFSHELQATLFGNGVRFPFHHLFYCPSRATEWKLGFDLSVGRNKVPKTPSPRIRTMHKLVTGRFCDGKWTCLFKDDDALHMALLMGAQQATYEHLYAFLVIHVCFCVHDYRRMGHAVDEERVIPSFASPLRTIIVDLQRVREKYIQRSGPQWDSFVKGMKECKNKDQALLLTDEFGVGRLKVSTHNHPRKLFPETEESYRHLMDKHGPALRYPSTAGPDTTPDLFLSFDQFAKRVVEIGQKEWQ